MTDYICNDCGKTTKDYLKGHREGCIHCGSKNLTGKNRESSPVNAVVSEQKLKPIKRAEILLIKTLHGFDSAEDEYGYDLANERYFVKEALKDIRKEANELTKADTQSNLKRLLPCPFCGAQAEGPHNETADSSKDNKWRISCVNWCVTMYRKRKIDLLNDWNKRAG